MIDDVQISKIANGSLTLPEDLTLNLTSGAKLDLDYIGTNKVMNVFFDGRRKSGVINAERFPDLVTGSGALFVKPLEFTIILR